MANDVCNNLGPTKIVACTLVAVALAALHFG